MRNVTNVHEYTRTPRTKVRKTRDYDDRIVEKIRTRKKLLCAEVQPKECRCHGNQLDQLDDSAGVNAVGTYRRWELINYICCLVK